MPIQDWPASERPRERLARHGVRALSDAELVALLLGSGSGGRSAIDVARNALARAGGLAALLAADASADAIAGIGPARHARLVAASELVRRALGETLAERSVFQSPQAVREYLKLHLAARPHEVFLALFLDAQHRLIAAEELFRGTLAQTSVYPREVVKRALAVNAAAVIFSHNHPSGVAEPSRADELLTQALRTALDLVDIRTLDHFIVAGSGIYAFSEHGKL